MYISLPVSLPLCLPSLYFIRRGRRFMKRKEKKEEKKKGGGGISDTTNTHPHTHAMTTRKRDIYMKIITIRDSLLFFFLLLQLLIRELNVHHMFPHVISSLSKEGRDGCGEGRGVV